MFHGRLILYSLPLRLHPHPISIFLYLPIHRPEPAGRHLPYFITLPSLPSLLQLAINEKLKMWEEGREEKSKGGSIGEGRKGSTTMERVNCERDSKLRDGAREIESKVSMRVSWRYSVQRQTEKGKKRGRAEP